MNLKESNPSINFEFAPPDRRAHAIFFESSQIRRHRRRIFSNEPQLDSSLCEHPLAPLYLPLALTCALFLSRTGSTVEHLAPPQAPVAGPLRPLSSFAGHSSTLQVLHRYSCSP